MRKILKKKLKSYWEKVLETKKSPHSIALGFALGSFIAILPTPGFSVLLGLVLMLVFKNMSKLSLFAAIAFWNPLIQIPLYPLSFKLGNLILGSAPVMEYQIGFFSQAFHYTRRYLLGNFILSITISILSYFLLKKAVQIYYKKRDTLRVYEG